MKNTFAAIKFWMDKILSIACAILLSFMTILVLIQVFTRFVLNNPVAFTEELVRYSLIWTGFIGAAYAFSTREHMSLTLVRDKFTGKAHTALLVAIDGLILLMAIFVFTIGGFKLAVSASREFSALLGIPVRNDVAMTGEITLRGKVLAIGGLKEKTMAAYRAGVKTVCIPKENEPDIDELDDVVKNSLKFVVAEDINTVLETALVLPNCEPNGKAPLRRRSSAKTKEAEKIPALTAN